MIKYLKEINFGVKIKNRGIKMKELKIPVDFADNCIFKSRPEYAVTYLYAYRHKVPGEPVFAEQIADALNLPLQTVKDAISYWSGLGYDIFTEKKIPPVPDKSRYSPKEITGFVKDDKNLALLYEETEKMLAKPLSTNDQQTLFWIYNDLGIEVPVIMLILNYAKSIDKLRIRYVEKIAMEWSEKGIVTYADAEEYLGKIEHSKTYEECIKRLFGIDRNLTSSEKTVIQSWCDDLKPSRESLVNAYEICVERTGKFSAKYINAVLVNQKNGTVKQAASASFPTPKSTSFNNFSQNSGIDYKKFEMDALRRRMSKNRSVNENE